MTALLHTNMTRDRTVQRTRELLEALPDEWPLADISNQLSRAHLSGLEKDVIGEAVKLQQNMHCTTSKYVQDYPEILWGAPLDEGESRKWNLRSITQWIPVERHRGIKGTFQCLFPAIFRSRSGGEDRVLVVKPVVLVFDEIGRNSTTALLPNVQRRERSQSPAPPPPPPPPRHAVSHIPSHGASNHDGARERNSRAGKTNTAEPAEREKLSRDAGRALTWPKQPSAKHRSRRRSTQDSVPLVTKSQSRNSSARSSFSESSNGDKHSSRHKIKQQQTTMHDSRADAGRKPAGHKASLRQATPGAETDAEERSYDDNSTTPRQTTEQLHRREESSRQASDDVGSHSEAPQSRVVRTESAQFPYFLQSNWTTDINYG